MLTEHQYGADEGSAYACVACERSVTGAGYRCGECDVNVHQACLGLPASVDVKERHEHALTLARLMTASGTCNACNVISHAGCYMYRCAACGFNLHPRCSPPMLAVDDGDHQQQQQQQQQQNRDGTAWRQVARGFVGFGLNALRILDEMTTGGMASTALDVVEVAVLPHDP
ncbi:hypothetical protein ABZP36_000587 [Zizania latifolia]